MSTTSICTTGDVPSPRLFPVMAPMSVNSLVLCTIDLFFTDENHVDAISNLIKNSIWWRTQRAWRKVGSSLLCVEYKYGGENLISMKGFIVTIVYCRYAAMVTHTDGKRFITSRKIGALYCCCRQLLVHLGWSTRWSLSR